MVQYRNTDDELIGAFSVKFIYEQNPLQLFVFLK